MAFETNDKISLSLEEQDYKQTAKYKRKNTLYNAMLGTICVAISLLVLPEAANAIKIGLQEYKTNDQILEDAKYFDADMRIAEYFTESNNSSQEGFKRLPHNNNKPIYVGLSKKFNAVDKDNIETAFSYYQDVLSTINQNYKFELVSQGQAYLQSLIGNNVIYFGEDKMEDTYGFNYIRLNLLNKNFLKDTIIKIKNDFNDQTHKPYTFMHEIAHSFGLGDTYVSTNANKDTFMSRSDFAVSMQMLFPNDVAILYAMYGESYRDKNGIDKDKLAVAQQTFENYKDTFYAKSIEVIKDNYGIKDLEDIDIDTINNKAFGFDLYSYDLVNDGTQCFQFFRYKAEIIDEKKALFIILNEKNQVVYETVTRYDYHSGAIFFPSVNFNKNKYVNISNNNNSKDISNLHKYIIFFKVDGQYKMFIPEKAIGNIQTFDREKAITFAQEANKTKSISRQQEEGFTL